MRIEGDDGGLQTILSCRLYEMMNQELMSPMHPSKKPIVATRLQLHGIVIMYCIHGTVFNIHIRRRTPMDYLLFAIILLKSSPQLARPKYNGG